MCLFYFILFFLNHLRSLDTASLTELCESICIAGKLKKMRLLAGFIFTTFFSFFFFFLMKEPCPLTFKSLSLQRKTASLIDTWEAVITLMKHRIKQLYFFLSLVPPSHLEIPCSPAEKNTVLLCPLIPQSSREMQELRKKTIYFISAGSGSMKYNIQQPRFLL